MTASDCQILSDTPCRRDSFAPPHDVELRPLEGGWHPGNDTGPWVKFCLSAHEDQALRLLHRLRDIERLWELCSELAASHRLPERVVPALVDEARGFRLRNASYRAVLRSTDALELNDHTASRDLRAIVDAGLVTPIGERRGRIYVANEPLRDAWQKVRGLRPGTRSTGGRR